MWGGNCTLKFSVSPLLSPPLTHHPRPLGHLFMLRGHPNPSIDGATRALMSEVSGWGIYVLLQQATIPSVS